MNRFAIVGALVITLSGAARAQSAPQPPPGSGEAERTIRLTLVREAPLLRDNYLATFCGFRSSARMDRLNTALRVMHDQLVNEWRPKASDPVRFTAYAKSLAEWLDNSWRPTDAPFYPRECDLLKGDRLDQLDAAVDAVTDR